VFAWIATRAVRAANGSRSRLLLLVYAAGLVTTAFLSNDATIVVLTPAVLAAVRPAALSAAALIGVNVGPNLTVNGSLATLLWLAVLRRAGVSITPLRFAAVGLVATPPALIAAALLAR
jgi:arsenical pump membrane protein